MKSDAPLIVARWRALSLWLAFNVGFQNALITFLSLIDPSYEPMYMIRVTNELTRTTAGTP